MSTGFSGVLSAQSMFPVLSPDEMAGHYGENSISKAVRQGFLSLPGGAWDQLAARVAAIPDYRVAFDALNGPGSPITFAEISNAIAAFIAHEWRADDSPFDRHQKEETALTGAVARGMELFYGRAACDTCHAGQFQTDHAFHAIAMPQIGPGKAERFETHARDIGRMRVTGREEDAYAFRTPSLRNVAFTAPYGHAGSFATLEAVIRHHLDPVASLTNYAREQVVLGDLGSETEDFRAMDDPKEVEAIAASNVLEPQDITDVEIAELIAFLGALTDLSGLTGRLGIPDKVPSGLSIPQ
jgi:cytochrome c peroxidase